MATGLKAKNHSKNHRKGEIENISRGEKVKNQGMWMPQQKFCCFPQYGTGVGKTRVFGKEKGKSISKGKVEGKTSY